jgi:alkylation response protein AidB-like acyl-CoA dehydrogenase
MDFAFNDDQSAVRDLARKIFAELAPQFDRDAWRTLGSAGLLGVTLPTSVGGSESGVVALCLLLEQAGEAASTLPLIPALVLAGLPLTQADASARTSAWLQRLCRGESVLSGVFGERGESTLQARRTAVGWRLSGVESCVEALPLADALLLAAKTERGETALFLVESDTPGLSRETQQVASGHPIGRLTLQDVLVEEDALLCDPVRAGELVDWALDRAYLAQAAYELGLSSRALALTARFASERQQFGRAIGTFQAVAQRVADAHIALETMRLSLWRAAWLVDEGASARHEIAVARVVATQAGHEIVCAAQHVHGSMGFDRSYPLHRYFLASQHNELLLGGHGFHLARLGQLLAN